MLIAVASLLLASSLAVQADVTGKWDGTIKSTRSDGTESEDTVLMILGLEAVLLVAVWVITYLYQVEFMRRGGQTLGKKAMKLKVVPLNPAAVLTRRMCLLRYLVQFLAGGFVPFFSWVDGLWQLWDKPFQQCLHDKAAQTVVVRVQSL